MDAAAHPALRVLEDVCAHWRRIDLAERKAELHTNALAITSSKEQYLTGRKALQERTKGFLRLDGEQKLQELPGLLKAYQNEINDLVKRAKEVDTAYLELYRLLADAPDPVPAMDGVLQVKSELGKAGTQQKEVRELQAKLREYERELSELQNQEVTIETLRATVHQFQERTEEMVSRAVEQRLAEYNVRNDTLVEALREREASLQLELDKRIDQYREAHRLRDVTQDELLRLRATLEEEYHNKERFDHLLVAEVEALTAKVAHLERENAQLRDHTRVSVSKESEWERDAQVKEEMIRSLTETRYVLEERLRREQVTTSELQAKLERSQATVAKLQTQIQNLPARKEYEELQRRLATLEAQQEAAWEKDWAAEEKRSPLAGAAAEAGPEAPAALAGQCRQLQARLAQAEAELHAAQEAAQQQAAVIQRLEADLGSKVGLALDIPKLAALQSVVVDPGNPARFPNSGDAAEPTGAEEAALLRIVTGQRDRFKNRMQALEAEKQQLEQRLKAATTELRSLKDDNVALYGRLRFQQHYYERQGGKLSPRQPAAFDEDDVTQKYRRSYEESINPFNEFHSRERELELRKLSVAERIALSTSRLVLMTRLGRYMCFVYSLSLHLLIGMVLYRLSARSHRGP